MHIAILDDSEADRRDLRQMLHTYFRQRKLEVSISEFARAQDFLHACGPGVFQIAFLDIYLDGESGMDAAREAFETDPGCRLVFFTTSFDYAVDSYLVRAAYYLTKPVERSRLYDALEICCRETDNASAQLTVRGIPTWLPLKDIRFADCENRSVRLHLADRTLEIDEGFARVSQTLLADPRFLACNRGVLVNMDHIRQALERDFLLDNGACAPIRVHGRKELKKAWLTYSLKAIERRPQP